MLKYLNSNVKESEDVLNLKSRIDKNKVDLKEKEKLIEKLCTEIDNLLSKKGDIQRRQADLEDHLRKNAKKKKKTVILNSLEIQVPQKNIL
jgi:Fic family protein